MRMNLDRVASSHFVLGGTFFASSIIGLSRIFGPPLKNLDPPKARAQRVLVGQFAVFLGRLSEFVSLR